MALGLLLCPGCEYQPKYQLMFPRGDVSSVVVPDLGVRDLDIDPEIYALYDQHCEMCHPDRGQSWGSGSPPGPPLVGVLTHNSREVTQKVIRFGGGEMVSMEESIDDAQAASLVELLSMYGEGFLAPATGDAVEGRAIFDLHCASCHPQGGALEQLIPELDQVAGLVSRGFLEELFGRDMGSMPAVPLDPGEVEQVLGHLQALAGEQVPSESQTQAFEMHCGGCHLELGRKRLRVPTIGQGGNLGPAALRILCVKGQGEMPGVMDVLADPQALDLQAYLRLVEPRRPQPDGWPRLPITQPDANAVARGRELQVELCQSCHGTLDADRPIWPHLRDAGYLHTPKYLKEITQDGGGAMPAFPELRQSELQELADYMESLSEEYHGGGAKVAGSALFEQQCEGCHQDGGRSPGIVPGLGTIGRDLSEARARSVLQEGFGSMASMALDAGQIDALVAFFQDGLATPEPIPAALDAAREHFVRYCEDCHHDGGVAPTQVPGIGGVMARASGDYLEDLVRDGLGWMPALPEASPVLVHLEQGLRQVAAGQAMEAGPHVAYDLHCRRCHLDPQSGDVPPAVAIPTVATTVGGRLSPLFVDDLIRGLGTMTAIERGVPGGDLVLRPYLREIAGAPLGPRTALPQGGDLATAAASFERLCGGCHRSGGLDELRLPLLARKLRFMSGEYVERFVQDPMGEMPGLSLGADEQIRIRSYCDAKRTGQPPDEAARQAYEERCGGCHPVNLSAGPIVVPHMVPVGTRLSRRFIIEASLRGVGTMAPALEPDGSLPSEAAVEATFPHLRWLAGQEGRPYPPDLDPLAVDRGRRIYRGNCEVCHAAMTDYDLSRQDVARGEFIPLQGLSGTLLFEVTRHGLGDMPAFDERSFPDEQLWDLVEYLLHLGQGRSS